MLRGCPVPKAPRPVLVPVPAPSRPHQPHHQGGLGAGAMPACPGAWGHGHALYFSLLFLVNKALDMPGVHGAMDGDGVGRGGSGH